MGPGPCDRHEDNELGCVDCTTIRREFYRRIGEEEEKKEEEWQTLVNPFWD